MPDDNKNDDGGDPFAPFLFVPYFAGDVGARPLPQGLPFWECPGIKFDGQPRASHGPFVPGQALGVSADVANAGGSGALVRIAFYWADPATAFTRQTLQLIGMFSEYRAAGQTGETQRWPWVPPANIPAHSCVLVEVSAPLDQGSGTFSPSDRHYAQQNLTFVVPGPGGAAQVRFRVANPWSKARPVILRTRAMSDAALDRITKQLRRSHADIANPAQVQLVCGERRSEGGIRFGLAGQESQWCEARIPLSTVLRRDQFAACVFEQYDAIEDQLIGALAVVVSTA